MFLAFTMLSVAPVHANAVPSIVWLPPLSNQEVFQLKDGSTVPIKFTLLGPEGSFIGDESVKVAVNKILLRDDFNDEDASGWNEINYAGTGAVFAVESGEYSLDSLGGGVVAIATQGEFDWTDYSVQVSVKKISGSGTNWPDIFIRYQDLGNFYYVQLTTSALLLRKRVSYSYSAIQTWSGSIDLSIWHNVKVVAVGSSLKVYLDGQLRIDATDSSFSTGVMGIGAWYSHVHFDNVLVLEELPIKVFDYGEGDDNVRIYADEGAYTIFSDTFSADSGTQPDQTWEEISGEWEVLDYEYQQTGNLYIPGARAFAGDTAWTDYTMTAKVNITDDGWGGVLLRANAAGDTYYELYLQRGGRLQLVKTVAGTRAGIMNPYVGSFADDYWYIKAQVVDDVVRGKAWPCSGSEPATWLVEWTDSTPITSGRIGLITFSWWDTQLPVWFDDITVQVGYYIANLHTKELLTETGKEYAITVWYQGAKPIKDTYIFEYVDGVQGTGRGKGRA